MTDTDRYKHEQEYFDDYAANVFDIEAINLDDIFSNNAFENRYTRSFLENIAGKHVLDLGCGVGEDTLFLLHQGAIVNAIDISPESVEVTIKLAKKFGLDHMLKAEVMTAENLKFEPESFDIIFGREVLHHVDLEKAGREIFRVLKKDGKAIFLEPLGYNPILKIYRWYSRKYLKTRTDHEEPLTFNQLYNLDSRFKKIEHDEFHLISLSLWFMYSFISKGKYWWRNLQKGREYGGMYVFLQKMDRSLFRIFPFFKRYCIETVVVYTK